MVIDLLLESLHIVLLIVLPLTLPTVQILTVLTDVTKMVYQRFYRKNSVPFPPTRNFKFKYEDYNIDLTAPATGVMSQHVYNLNCLNDPNSTGGIHQPMFYETMLGADNGPCPYHFSAVYGCKVTLTYVNVSDVPGHIYYSVWDPISTSRLLLTTIAEIAELPNVGVGLIGSNISGKNSRSFSFYINMSKITGIDTDEMLNGPGYKAAFNSNPSNLIKMAIGFSPTLIGSIDPCFCDVKFTFYSKLFGQNSVAPSTA